MDLPTAVRSVIDARERAALTIVEAVYDGDISSLRSRGRKLDAVPASLGIRLLVGALGAVVLAVAGLAGCGTTGGKTAS